MKRFLSYKAYQPFYLLYLLFLLIGGIFLLSVNREESHLILNQFFYPSLHQFFIFVTHLAEGYVIGIVLALLLFVRFRYFIQFGLASLFAGATTQLLKHFVFEDLDRPSWFFKHYSPNSIQTIENFTLNIHHSFPSGHTTSAFAIFVSLFLIIRKRSWTFACFFLALLIGYSRVYLSQHFFIDIYFGSLVGTLWSIAAYLFVQQMENNRTIHWWNKSLLKLK